MTRGDNVTIGVDDKGYMLDAEAWSAEIARSFAKKDGMELTPQHFEIIHMLRDYYFEFEMAPPIRLLIKAIGHRLGAEKANSRYLYRLFPEGPAKQACRYAGLPKPVSCV